METVQELKERFNNPETNANEISSVSDKTINAYINRLNISHFPGDWEFRSNSAKLCFFVDNKERFISILEKQFNKLSEKNMPSIFPFETVENEMTEDEVKEYDILHSLIGILKDNMTTQDIINF